jgi:hypothetical protein
MEEYIYDLDNTWNLNVEMLGLMLQDLPSFSNEQKKNLFQTIHRIKEYFSKIKKLREEKLKARGKVLMDKQILEEIKRRNEENNAYYQEQMDEIRENLEKKESFIKQFEKKFNEVEIYVQREAKANPDLWEKFTQFEIIIFISNNEYYQRQQIKINEEIQNITQDMNEILRENIELKKRDEYIDMSDDYDNQKFKYKSLINLYKSKIKFLERNSEHLRNVLNSVNCKLNNISSYNDDLKGKIKSSTKEKLHNKLNLVAGNSDFRKPSDNKLNFLHELGTINDYKEINNLETKSENNDENFGGVLGGLKLIRRKSDNENDLDKSNVENLDNKNHSLMEEPSMLVKATEFNREMWDISCIENTEP